MKFIYFAIGVLAGAIYLPSSALSVRMQTENERRTQSGLFARQGPSLYEEYLTARDPWVQNARGLEPFVLPHISTRALVEELLSRNTPPPEGTSNQQESTSVDSSLLTLTRAQIEGMNRKLALQTFRKCFSEELDCSEDQMFWLRNVAYQNATPQNTVNKYRAPRLQNS